MLRWVFFLLLLLNLGFALWGWSHERPLEAPLPPLPKAPEEIRLPSELTHTANPAVAPGNDAAPSGDSMGSEGEAVTTGSGNGAGGGATPNVPVVKHPGTAKGPPKGGAPGALRSGN
jgi:hypothetical protein